MLEFEPDHDPVTPRDSATVLLLRPANPGFSIFMVKRHAKSRFMAGAYVFPGGRVDDADQSERMYARCLGVSENEARTQLDEPQYPHARSLFVAALRETFEESGVLLTDRAASDATHMRDALNQGDSFVALLEAREMHLRLDRLIPFSRWITPAAEKRRYDARFFLATVDRKQEAEHDGHEVTAGAWLTPQQALQRFANNEIQLAPPTLRTLEQLTAYDEIDNVLNDAKQTSPPCVCPVFRMIDGIATLTLPGDPEHPEPGPLLPGSTRFQLRDGRFVSAEP